MAPVESPPDIFAAGCATLAAAFADDGFAYRRSHPKLVRKLGDFTEEVLFRTSRHNEAGALTQLWIDLSISSRRMAGWRARHPAPVVASFVGGTALANLVAPETDWNLASRTTRARTLRAAEEAIRTVGLPWLALLRDPVALECALLARDLHGMTPDALIDPLVCFGGVAAGARYAAAIARRHRGASFETFAARLVQLGVPRPRVRRRR